VSRHALTAWALLAGLAVGGCGDGTPAMPDTSKRVPQVPLRYQRLSLEEWKALPTDVSPEKRTALAFALAALEPEPLQSAPILLRLIQDDDPSVVLAAVVATARLAPKSPRLAQILAGLLESSQEPLRRHARLALGELGSVAQPALEKALGHASITVQWGALVALDRIWRPTGDGVRVSLDGAPGGFEATPPWVMRVADLVSAGAHASVREQALLTLARLVPHGAELCALHLGGSDIALSDRAAVALARAGENGTFAVIVVLARTDEVKSALAAGVIGDIAARGPLGSVTPSAVTALVGALAREGPVRFNASDALLAIGKPARAALEAALANPALKDVASELLKDKRFKGE
jgi:hypothetical protein